MHAHLDTGYPRDQCYCLTPFNQDRVHQLGESQRLAGTQRPLCLFADNVDLIDDNTFKIAANLDLFDRYVSLRDEFTQRDRLREHRNVCIGVDSASDINGPRL